MFKIVFGPSGNTEKYNQTQQIFEKGVQISPKHKTWRLCFSTTFIMIIIIINIHVSKKRHPKLH